MELYDILVENSLDKVMSGFVNKTKNDLLFNQNVSHQDESINISYRSENKSSSDAINNKNKNVKKSITEEKKKIAIVDDDKVVHAIVRSVFKQFDWELCCYKNGADFLSEPHINES